MNDVRIDGVRYVPVTKNPTSHHINRLSNILDAECPYLSRTVRNNIIKQFKDDEVEVTKPKSKPSKKKEHSFSVDNFDRTDDAGHVIFKRGKHKVSGWTVYQVAEIRQWLNYGKYMSDADRVKQLSQKYDLSQATLRNIVVSLKDEKFCDWIDSEISSKSESPNEENPKSEDVGWFE